MALTGEAGREVHDADAEQVSGSATAVEAGAGRAVGGAGGVPLLGTQETPEALYRRSYGQLVGLALDHPRHRGRRRGGGAGGVRPRPVAGSAPRPRLLPYVRTAVVNECRSRFRRRSPVVPTGEPAPSAEHVAGESARRADVVRALAELPSRQREVVALRYFGTALHRRDGA